MWRTKDGARTRSSALPDMSAPAGRSGRLYFAINGALPAALETVAESSEETTGEAA